MRTSPPTNDGQAVIVACTDDYRPYRMLLAVDRDRLPGPADLPTDNITGVPDGSVERPWQWPGGLRHTRSRQLTNGR